MSVWDKSLRPEQLRCLPDEALCRGVAAGSHEAFLELFDRYWRQVYRLAYSVIRDPAEAEDLAQNLFLEVHASLLHFDQEKGSFRSLLLRYAYTRAVDQRRRLVSRHFYSNVHFEEVDPSMFADNPSLTYGLSIEEGAHLIEQGMKELDAKQRATVEAYFFRGLSVDEIAKELGESFGNVRHYLYRGLEKMRKLLAPGAQGAEPEERDRKVRLRVHRRANERLASEVSVVRTRSI
jgi:RNA polymerase sigma-70 factor (ECF subfamily)